MEAYLEGGEGRRKRGTSMRTRKGRESRAGHRKQTDDGAGRFLYKIRERVVFCGRLDRLGFGGNSDRIHCKMRR
jgi:hypothetical protein